MKENQSALAIKYFLDNFSLDVLINKIKPSNKEEELALVYLNLLTDVFNVFDRLIRYEKYFKEFIPPKGSGISESEAIEYHFRAYLEDFYILQERIKAITKKLIRDIPNYKIQNPNDCIKALEHINKNFYSKFKKITSGLRKENVHIRSVSEPDLVIGKLLSSLLSGDMPIIEGKALNRDSIKNRHDEVLASMKDKYERQANYNSASLRKMKEWFASRFIHVFSSLNGHKISGLDMSIE